MTAFPTPDRPDLRTHRFNEDGERVEHWIWEPGASDWRLSNVSSRAELDARAESVIDPRPLTEAEIEHARQLAREHGW